MKYQQRMVLYTALYLAFPLSVFVLIYGVLFTGIDRTLLYFILAIHIVLISVCIKVITRFDRQSGRLERAARRIAGGDLDYSLTASGDDEFSGLIRSLEQMRISLKEEQAKRFRFLMAVSHDLNTPLTSIKGYIEALIDGVADDPEVQRKYYGIINDKSGLLEERIQELIDYVKTETGDWRLQAGDITAVPFFRRVVYTYRHDAEIMRREFECTIDIPPNVYFQADETLIFRVFENLFSNAFRYSSEGDCISFDAHIEEKAIVVSVKDTGIGIEQEKLPLVFDPFYRGSHSRREKGHGLGLSTVKNIIRSHDWKIKVFSTIGKGTEFVIRITPFYFNNARQ